MTRFKYLIVLPLLLAVSAPAWAETETEYLAVLMDGKKIGHAVHTRAVEAGQVTTSDDVSITISRLGIPVTIRMTETSVETVAGKPVGFESVQDLGAVSMKVVGRVNGNGMVDVVNSGLGTEQKSTMPWPAGAIMAEGLRLLTLKQGLKSGTEYTVNLFSPGIMQALATRVVIGEKKEVDLLGRVVKLTEMSSTLDMPGTGPITSVSYVDDNLETLKSVVPIAGMQVVMVSCPKEFALSDNDVVDMIDKMFVKCPAPVGNITSASAVAYLLRPAAGANLVIPTTDNQRAQRLPDGRIALMIEPVAAPKGGTFPYKGNDAAVLEATRPTRFLQSDDQKIVELAHKAVGDTKDAAEAARRIESFVAGYISNRSLSVGYASAAEVVESRQGDCSEFAVLTAALCRAVGIPAQVAVGVAYVKDFAGIEGFGGHAWTQAYLTDARGQNGRWVGLDAAFKGSGRGGYDAGHIALAVGNGEPGDFFNMASALGQFTIEKITVQRGR
jgi:transglutaminase-like putative cysteine protease